MFINFLSKICNVPASDIALGIAIYTKFILSLGLYLAGAYIFLYILYLIAFKFDLI